EVDGLGPVLIQVGREEGAVEIADVKIDRAVRNDERVREAALEPVVQADADVVLERVVSRELRAVPCRLLAVRRRRADRQLRVDADRIGAQRAGRPGVAYVGRTQL